uniref:Fibronectin type-III domain-containing protein n=1 Tax=Noctiluca scintillans TaxID=2966 RepID=A0A7S1AAN8_NOCSC|mmetsp:Transcript_38552/g.102528  ORF Transcript_38552/g.102528 Transcript_38552/m.102528 type:complete len:857 (+) Transcript_38552:1-2571(+)
MIDGYVDMVVPVTVRMRIDELISSGESIPEKGAILRDVDATDRVEVPFGGDVDKNLLLISGHLRKYELMPVEEVYSVPGLQGRTEYYVAVAARNSVGLSEFGQPTLMATLAAAPLAIHEVTCLSKDTESVVWRWAEPDHQGAIISCYDVRYASEEDALLLDTCSMFVVDSDAEFPSCRIEGLLPGTWYHMMVRARNEIGVSPWTKAKAERTESSVPGKMRALRALPHTSAETDCLTFAWELPYSHGEPIQFIEIRYVVTDLEHGEFLQPGEATLQTILEGELHVVRRSERTGEFPTEHTFRELEPHSIIVPIARAINVKGAGDWGERPVRDLSAKNLNTSYALRAGAPTPPEPPVFDIDTMTMTSGAFSFSLGKSNASLYTSFDFRLYAGTPGDEMDAWRLPLHENADSIREWSVPVSRGENLRVLQNDLLMRQLVSDLQPGTAHALQVRSVNSAGSSAWSTVGTVARTLPDAPIMTSVLTLECTSPVHIAMKWIPPFHSGAIIEGYEIRYTEHQEAPLEEWSLCPESDIREKSFQSEVVDDAIAFGVFGLGQKVGYYFKFRARNVVGFSDWSPVAHFWTRPSPPVRVDLPVCELQSTRLTMDWQEPECHGCSVTRYEVLVSMKKSILHWERLVGEKLWWSPDLVQVFGLFKMADDPIEALGQECLSLLDCDAACALPLSNSWCELDNLVPGMTYHGMVRAVSEMGMGKWSEILTPMLTHSIAPRMPEPFVVESVTSVSCTLSYCMPYDNGSLITEAVARSFRVHGPLGDDELDAQTGSAHIHHSEKEQSFDPHAYPSGSDRFKIKIGGLLPGNHYEVSWAACNAHGVGDFSVATPFTTVAALPDMPEASFLGTAL